jgi:aryl-alcohol dehydrogenase-like predicted oxidoreductase
MQYSLLGNTGLTVSRLAFGAMTFTAGNKDIGAVYKVGADLAGELVGKALNAGINFFDTADGYAGGESEAMLGAALKPHRDRVVIATKVGFRTGPALTRAGLNRRHILWSVDQSLKRLGTDWIDVYIAHREDPYTPLEETLAALELQKANGLAPFTHGQMYYSLVGRDVERDVIPMMRHYGLGLTVWSPLAFGFLSGKYTRQTLSDPNNRLSGFDFLPFDKERGFELVERMRAIAGAHDASVAQVALAWLLARQGVTSVIVGSTKRSQLDDNLKSVAVTLTAAQIAELDAATKLAPVYPNFFTDSIATDQPLATALRT